MRERRVLCVSVTERGRALAAALPYEQRHGDLAATVRAQWNDVDAFVLFLATGAATRIVGPLLADKREDPAVVCVDDGARFAVALCGGHAGGANELAREVAALIGAEPVVTTATDLTGTLALDTLPGFVAEGDVAAVTTALLDGRSPIIDNPRSWPLPPELVAGPGPERIVITDDGVATARRVVVLRPPSLVAGIGASSGAPREEIDGLLRDALDDAHLARASIAEVATVDVKANEAGIVALGLPVRTYAASALARVTVPNPSAVVDDAVGTPSVAEAAALLAAGPGAELVVTKRRSAHATVAVARRRGPRGHVAIVGLGPGCSMLRTPAADRAVRNADVVIGYERYVDLCRDVIGPQHEVITSPIGDEVVRAKQALAEAASGRRVALVCSGDAGIYGMASITLELAPEVEPAVDIEVVPGVTAGLAAAALLGAPLGHDHAVISLSDLLTPWPVITRRVRAAAEADMVVVLYNPRSRGRPWQLRAACDILGERRPSTTPVGVVTDAGRPSQTVQLVTLATFDHDNVGMTTCVVVGSSTTRAIGGRMVTPRGYES
jgi:cobalt-precorrin 5A hydrolase/precorrin-3B C17-methyltransferase